MREAVMEGGRSQVGIAGLDPAIHRPR